MTDTHYTIGYGDYVVRSNKLLCMICSPIKTYPRGRAFRMVLPPTVREVISAQTNAQDEHVDYIDFVPLVSGYEGVPTVWAISCTDAQAEQIVEQPMFCRPEEFSAHSTIRGLVAAAREREECYRLYDVAQTKARSHTSNEELYDGLQFSYSMSEILRRLRFMLCGVVEG